MKKQKQIFVPAWNGEPVVPQQEPEATVSAPEAAPTTEAAPEPTSDKPMDMDFAMKALLLMLCAKNKREHEEKEAAALDAARRGH